MLSTKIVHNIFVKSTYAFVRYFFFFSGEKLSLYLGSQRGLGPLLSESEEVGFQMSSFYFGDKFPFRNGNV